MRERLCIYLPPIFPFRRLRFASAQHGRTLGVVSPCPCPSPCLSSFPRIRNWRISRNVVSPFLTDDLGRGDGFLNRRHGSRATTGNGNAATDTTADSDTGTGTATAAAADGDSSSGTAAAATAAKGESTAESKTAAAAAAAGSTAESE